MQRSRRVLVAAVTVVALVALALLLVSSEWLVPSTRTGADAAAEERFASSEEIAASSSIEELASDELRRALEATPSNASAPIADTPAPTDGAVVVLVKVSDNAWLARGWRGRLRWSDDASARKSYDVANLRVTLPRAPQSIAQFTKLSFDGLAARPVALTPLVPPAPLDDIGTAPTFELLAEVDTGAVLVWSPTVPRDEQCLVHITFGGIQPPGTVGRTRIQGEHVYVNSLRDVELPFALPRVAAPTSIWVGAASRQWRAIGVAPEETRIELVLEHSATLRVLHDGTVGTRVVASASRLRQEVRAPIDGDAPIELTDLTAADFQVWIESANRSREIVSRVANVALVGGVTTEVDLRASANLDGRGTARILVRAAPEVIASATEGVELAWVHDEAEGARVVRLAAPRSVASSEEGLTFEALGLDPGRYEVVASPFVRTAVFDVVAGEVTEVEIVVDCVGFVRFELPAGVGGFGYLMVEPVDGRPEPRRYQAWAPQGPGALLPLACGTYRVIENGSDVVLESDVFAVTSGATTTAVMRALPLSLTTLEVVDAVSGDPIAFEAAFWTSISVRVDANGERATGGMGFGAVKGAYTSVELKFMPRSELVRVTVPEHPFWTFEALEPLVLTDGATITLRATAK